MVFDMQKPCPPGCIYLHAMFSNYKKSRLLRFRMMPRSSLTDEGHRSYSDFCKYTVNANREYRILTLPTSVTDTFGQYYMRSRARPSDSTMEQEIADLQEQLASCQHALETASTKLAKAEQQAHEKDRRCREMKTILEEDQRHCHLMVLE